MKIKLALLIVFIAISFSPKAFADFYMNIADDELQQKQVTGTVTDAGGNPLPGVSVVVKGTTLGTLTDAAGKYTLTNIPQSATLVFSFIGMATKEIPASDRSQIDIIMSEEAIGLDEVIVIGYGTAKKSDLTGSVVRVTADDFKNKQMVQVSEMLTGTVAGFNTTQGTSAAGGASMEIRGPKSLSAGTSPLIVLDGVVFKGSIREINPFDIKSIDIMKDASSAAVYGSNAATGVILITTNKGSTGKPTINFSTKLGVSENINQLRGLGPAAYLKFREDYLRQVSPSLNYYFYSNPEDLPDDMTVDQWKALSASPQADPTLEWLARLRLFPEEQANYLAGRTMDMYDEVFQRGFNQDYDLGINGGTDNSSYYWSIGYNNNEGIRTGDKYSSIRSRLNVDFKIVDWLNVGLNAHFSDRDESSVPASLDFWSNSPYGEMFDSEGNLKRLPHGHTDNPLLETYRTDLLNKTFSLFTNMYAEFQLPLGIKFRTSFQPKYAATKYYSFTKISKKLGAFDNETPSGEREESSSINWMVDNILSWKKEIGIHNFDVTLLANIEENKFWSSNHSNQNFQPSQELSYHGLQYGDAPAIIDNDTRSTGDALMARLNYILMGKYLFTGSIRKDGYSAFGTKNPRATFPAIALAWVISEENFFRSDLVDRLKLRFSWGVNGNRNIGQYSALANVNSLLWYDGVDRRIGIKVVSLANKELKWERTESYNLGLDVSLLKGRIDLTLDAYDMTTSNLLMTRVLPRVTGFTSIMANLGELGNKGFEMTLNTKNVTTKAIDWKSSLVFSFNRNKIKRLFGDTGTYTITGQEKTGELPDFTNNWFPGEDIDVVWNYDVTGIWQTEEAETAKIYNLSPGDFKAVDVNNDGRYFDLDDKQFIGYETPRYRLGFGNTVDFLKHFSANIFLRADLGHIGAYSTGAPGQADRANKSNGPDPYWTVDKPNNEFPRLNHYTAAFGGGLQIYKPKSFVRVQDLSLSYYVPAELIQRTKFKNIQIFGTIRNLATFTKWPGWDPESGGTPMPRTYTAGLSFSL